VTARAARIFGSVALGLGVCLALGSPRAQVGQFADQAHGRYLAAVGDCAACHTAEGERPLSGGRPIETPFGVIYSPNITSDAETGIGSWTDEQFYRAMHEGVAPNGSHLYPAFPYPWFTKATRQDIDDLRAYLRTVPPVRSRRPPSTFPWPLSEREAMIGWNALYFRPGTYTPDPTQSAQWNRGAYLVEGLAHCGACHTPVNELGASETKDEFQGGELQHWFAPDLTPNKRFGLGAWSIQDIVDFLKNGETTKTVAFGPMRQVVRDSTSKMTATDLADIAVYLRSLPATPESSAPNRPPKGVRQAGAAIYRDSCSACHGLNGEGVAGLFPALKGDAIVQSSKATSLVRIVLDGERGASSTSQGMPAYDWKLSDAQIASVTSFLREAWGNAAAPVSAGDVGSLRHALKAVKTDD
jgi:mono/diheme cytochrome c family protein